MSEKNEVIVFHSLEDLYKTIKEDKNSTRVSHKRFSVRFIFLNSFDELRSVVKVLTEKFNVKCKEITTLMSHKDQWLTSREIATWIQGMSDDVVIVSLSEFLRFQDDNEFYGLLMALVELETQKNSRIYIPLVGVWERFKQKFLDIHFLRKEWAPIWKVDTSSQKVHLYHVDFNFKYSNIQLENFVVVSNVEEWFNIWKKPHVDNILSFSRTLSYFYKNFLPDQIFDLTVIRNQKEFVQDILKITVPINFKKEEVQYWNKLIEESARYKKKQGTIKDIFLDHFNLGSLEKLTPQDFLEMYLRSNDEYERWLIKNIFLMLDRFQSSYLYHCFKKLKKLGKESLIKELWLEIFQIPLEEFSDDNFSERKKLLNFAHKELNFSTIHIEEILAKNLEKLRKYTLSRRLEYLTDITFSERKYIVDLIKNGNISNAFDILMRVYPKLAYYLDWELIRPDNDVPDWIITYFREYNYSKIRHIKSQKIEELIREKNKNKASFSSWYYSIPKPKLNDDCKYVWVDGLGAEWFPLLVHLLDEYGKAKGKSITTKRIVRVNLPSNTKCNRYEYEKINELDRYIHNQNPYTHPDDLINEIEIVDKIARKIVEMPHDKIGIVSDHGFSFLCLKEFGNTKVFDFENTEHEGRYMWIDKEGYRPDPYYITWVIEEGPCKNRRTLVALKHKSLSTTPCREVHGGATPEEVLVPYIMIETRRDKIEYKIESIISEVDRVNPIAQVRIYPRPLYMPRAFIGEKQLTIYYQRETDVYNIDLSGLKPGEYGIKLKIGDTEKKIIIKIKGGFKERDLI